MSVFIIVFGAAYAAYQANKRQLVELQKEQAPERANNIPYSQLVFPKKGFEALRAKPQISGSKAVEHIIELPDVKDQIQNPLAERATFNDAAVKRQTFRDLPREYTPQRMWGTPPVLDKDSILNQMY